jgi:hypothetical protein
MRKTKKMRKTLKTLKKSKCRRMKKTNTIKRCVGGNPRAMKHELLDWIDISKLNSAMLSKNPSPHAIHLMG